jgi:hypothetical protein
VHPAHLPSRRPAGRRATRWIVSATAVASAGLLAAGCTASAGAGAGTGAGSPSQPTRPTQPAGGTAGSLTLPPPSGPPATGTSPPTGNPTPAGSGSPAVYRFGPRDSGKRVVLRVGDRLEITLTGTRVGALWRLAGYPQAALRPDLRRSPLGRFDFVAQAPGSGNVMFVRARCGTPPDRPCLDLPEPGDPTPAPPVPRAAGTFTIQVQVV